MSDTKDIPPVQIDSAFLKNIQVGNRLFHYPSKGNAEDSFTKSGPAEDTLYSVIDLPTEDQIVVVRVFDKTEKKHIFSRNDLLTGDWWHLPNR